jgi:hypothetical protein
MGILIEVKHMKIKHLFSITAILSFVNGLFYLLAPEYSLSLLGQATNAIGILNTRYFGAAALGISAIAWFARKIESSEFQRIIAKGVLITLSASAFVGFMGTISGTVNQVGWLLAGTDTLLSLGFFLLLVNKHAPR